MYLLDTNICIALLAGKEQVSDNLKRLDRVRVYLSAITVAELAYGAMRSSKPAYEMSRIRGIMREGVILPVDSRVALEYGVLKAHLAACGKLLEDNDLFIASTALSRGLTLVTHDRAFARVLNLKLEDWLD